MSESKRKRKQLALSQVGIKRRRLGDANLDEQRVRVLIDKTDASLRALVKLYNAFMTDDESQALQDELDQQQEHFSRDVYHYPGKQVPSPRFPSLFRQEIGFVFFCCPCFQSMGAVFQRC